MQQKFQFETPTLVILSSLVFPIMSIPGVVVSFYWTRSKERFDIFYLAALFTLMGASIRCCVLVFNQRFIFVVAGNALIGFGHSLVLCQVNTVVNKWFKNDERFICKCIILSSLLIGVCFALRFLDYRTQNFNMDFTVSI